MNIPNECDRLTDNCQNGLQVVLYVSKVYSCPAHWTCIDLLHSPNTTACLRKFLIITNLFFNKKHSQHMMIVTVYPIIVFWIGKLSTNSSRLYVFFFFFFSFYVFLKRMQVIFYQIWWKGGYQKTSPFEGAVDIKVKGVGYLGDFDKCTGGDTPHNDW